jgi:hypothetical protein
MIKNKIFFETMEEFVGEKITDNSFITPFETDGNELQKICESYFLKKLEQTGLKHFSSGEKAKYILMGFVIGTISLLITSLLIAATIYIK